MGDRYLIVAHIRPLPPLAARSRLWLPFAAVVLRPSNYRGLRSPNERLALIVINASVLTYC